MKRRSWVKWARIVGGVFLISTGLAYQHYLSVLFGIFLFIQSFTAMPCGFCEAGFCELPPKDDK